MKTPSKYDKIKAAAAPVDAAYAHVAPRPLDITSNMHGAGRPAVAVPSQITRAANTWAGAYLPGYHINELERGLALVLKHPDQASRGYSKAKDARARLQLEINRRKAQPKA